jgi:neutral/alkaline ceramidase-like enzyme
MFDVGVAVVDITPPAGLAMAGFAARTQPATGAHDRLTARAIAVGDTAIVVADVLGIHEAMSARIRERCCLPADNVIVAALHNHGGPASMAGRAGHGADPAYLAKLESACIAAIDAAVANQQKAEMTIGTGGDPDVARNRRHPGGPVDRALPVLRIRKQDGAMLAVITSYACHPVVLGADNLLWTADYPHFVRRDIEAAYPGATVLFLTGCTGDANTGHSAQASLSLGANAERSFATAERLGRHIAEAALQAPEAPVGPDIGVGNAHVLLGFERREKEPLPVLAARWRAESAADPTRAALLQYWIEWAESNAEITDPPPWPGRVTLLNWGGVAMVALPGEIFAETGLSVRAALQGAPAFVFSYADGTPGYIPPVSEYGHGGYEVDEAHRYFGLPASFAPGSAEALADAATTLLAAARPLQAAR